MRFCRKEDYCKAAETRGPRTVSVELKGSSWGGSGKLGTSNTNDAVFLKVLRQHSGPEDLLYV